MVLNKKYFTGSLLFILSFCLCSTFSRLGIDLHHQGIMYNAAKCVYNGKKLYLDCYYHYGPFVAYLQGFSLVVFGDKLFSINLLTSICYSFFYLQFFLFLTKEFNILVSFFFTLIWLLFSPFLIVEFMPWSSVYILIPYTFLLYSYIYYKPTKSIIFLWGILVGVIIFSRQSVGIPLFLAMLVCLKLRDDINIKTKLNFLYGFVFLLIPVLIFMHINGFLESYIQSAFFGQFQFVTDSVGIVSKNYFQGFILLSNKIISCFLLENIYFEKYSSFWRMLLLIFILCSFFNLKHLYLNSNNSKFKIALSIIILASVSLIQIFPVPCIRHYFWSFSPIIPILIIQFNFYLKRAVYKKSIFELLLIFSFLTFLIIYGLLNLNYRKSAAIINLQNYNQKNSTYYILDGIRLNNSEKYFFDTVLNFNGKFEVLQSEFMPFMLTNFNKKIVSVGNTKICISNMPIFNTNKIFSIPIKGQYEYRQQIRGNGKRMAYFFSDTLYYYKKL